MNESIGLAVRLTTGSSWTRPKRETALRWCEGLAALTQVVSSGEAVLDRANRRPGGFNDYITMAGGESVRPKALRKLVDFVSRPVVADVLHAARVVAGVALLVPVLDRRGRFAADAFLATTQFLLYPNMHYGTDGSDHASFLVQSSCAVARATPSTRMADAALWYIAAQGTASYGVSGLAKVISPVWRSGAALSGIVRTRAYGARWAWRLIEDHPRTSKVVGAAVVAAEALFPAVLVGPVRRLASGFVAAMIGFHMANSVIMGLNRFLPAFASLHPAVLYVTGPTVRLDADGSAELRDDRMLRILLGTGALILAGSITDRLLRARRVQQPTPDEHTLITRRGTTLRFRRHGPARAGAGAPVVVCEAGLGSTGDHWAWFADALPGCRVVTYHRAGYGSSRPPARTTDLRDTDLLGRAQDDLADLVAQEADGAPVVLVGHSLGGHLAVRFAAEHPDLVRALVLLDPTTLPDGEDAAEAGPGDALRSWSRWLRLGFGGLVEPPPPLLRLPRVAAARVADQWRDVGHWDTTRREWAAAQRSIGIVRPAPALPTLVLTAERSAEDDPTLLDRHLGLAAWPGSGHRIIPRSNHQSLLTTSTTAATVAADVRQFIDGLPAHTEQRQAVGA